jgi:hypothetical protein
VPARTVIDHEDDPRRCQAVSGTRQCHFQSEEGLDFCSYHSSGQRLKLKTDEKKQYLLTRWRAEIDRFANHSQVKSLREEIGVLRLLMQTTLERCMDADDLMIYSGKIMELTQRIERVVETCHKMEEKTQFLVDKNQIVHLAEQILLIISEFIPDLNILTLIANKIQQAIEAKAVVTVQPNGEIVEVNQLESK